MKEKRMTCVILALFAIICFAGSALGAGIEPPRGYDPAPDCECLFEKGQPDVKIKGPYQKGTFTVSNGPDNSESYGFNVYITHLFLRWGNTVFLSPPINFTGGKYSICQSTDEEIAQTIVQSGLMCYLETEVTFGQEGTPLVKEVIITDRAGCDTPSIFDDIVRGEIIVGVVPTSLVIDGGECVEPPIE